MSICDTIIISHPDADSSGVNRWDGMSIEQPGHTLEMTAGEERLRGPS